MFRGSLRSPDDALRLGTEIGEQARDYDIHGASLTAIGAHERCTLGWFDWEKKEYVNIPVDEQCEVATLIGEIGRKDGEPAFHAHMVVGTKGGTAHAGHVMEA